MTSPAIRFDEPRRGSASSDGLRNIARAVDPRDLPALYDEALALAAEGHLAPARDRLRMLLCLDPEDGPSRLLLAKVFAAQQRWSDAKAELDRAIACGQRPDDALSTAVEDGLSEVTEHDSRKQHVVAERARAELVALRDETRQLRAENARLEQESEQATGRVRRWTTTTTVVAVVASLLLTATVVANRSEAETPEPAPLTSLEAVNAAPVAAPMIAPAAAPVAAPVAQPVAKPAAAGARTWVVKKNDTLSSISREVYGRSSQWTRIRDANAAKLGSKNRLQVGMELVIPE